MAYSHIPTFVAKGAFQSGIAALTVPVPTGYRNNDLLMLFVESANQAITAPTGWLQVTGSPQSTGTAAAIGGVRLGVFYKVAAGTEASVTVADTGDHTTAIMMAFRGVDPASPINITAGRVDAAATTAMSWAAATTTVANTLIVLATALDQDIAGTAQVGTVTNANLSSITEQHDQTITSGVGGGLHVATGIKATAGSTGTSTATGAASTTHAYLTIALQGRSDAIVVPRGQYQSDLETVVSAGGAYTDGATDGIYLAADISPVWEQDTTYQAKAEIETTATSFDDTATITNSSFEPEATDTNYTPRGGSLVYDSKNDRYIFFGGYDGATRYNNVWAKEMATPGRPWRKLNPTGTPPSAKNLAAASYFRGNKTTGGADTAIMILWGGAAGSDLNEMHILNVTTPGSEAWTTVTQTSAPSVRSYIQRHAVAVPVSGDTSQCNFYLFGGWAASRENSLFRCTVDLDSLGSVTWTTLKANGAVGNPTIRSGAILDYKASTSKLYLYGGYSGSAYLTDFWEYDIAGNTWTNTSPTGTAPAGTEFPVGGYDVVNNRFWYSGGYQGSGATAKNNVGYISDVGGSEAYNEVRAHDSDNMQYTGHGSAANCIDTTRNWLVLHGMQTVDSTERYSFIIDLSDGITSSKPVYGLSEGEFLNARDAMASVYNPVRDEWLIIGGFGNMSDDTTIATGQHLNDIWAYDYTNNRWRWVNKGHKAMPQSEGLTAVYDTTRDRVVSFGGCSGVSETGNEVWTATADENGLYEWERLTPTGTPPTARWLAHGAYDATNDRCIFALGGNDVGPFNEVWELSFSSSSQGVWTQRTPSGSATAVMGGGYVNKTSNSRMYIFGGATNAGLSTVSSQLVYLDYSTTNCAWTTPTSSGGTARRTPALVYDATNDRLITFGGFNGTTQLEALAYWNVAAAGAWANVTPSSTLKPDARRSHGHVFINGEMHITHGRQLSGDMWYRNTWKHTPNYTTPSSSTWTSENPRVFQRQYFFFDPNTSGEYHWQAWSTEESTDHTKVTFSTNVDTYYFDASDAATTDPNSVWDSSIPTYDDSYLTDSSSTTNASTLIDGSTSSNFLKAEGTNAPSSGGIITQVRARLYVGSIPTAAASATIYTDGLAESLGTASFVTSFTVEAGSWTTLSTPSGGWTWAKVQALEAKVYATDATSSGFRARVGMIEIEVSSSDSADFILGTSGPATITISHTTNALKRLNTIRTHTTDSIKRKQFTLAHATSSYLRKQATTSHTTDANKRKTTTKTHTTDSNKKKSYTVSHSTDTNKKVSGFTRTHTTDAFLRRAVTHSHTTDANKKKSSTLSHTTDSLKRKSSTVSHSTDSYITPALVTYTKTHTTDALKRKTVTVAHTTDANKKLATTKTHTTDANKRKSLTVSHTTDANKRKALSLTHTTNSFVRKQSTLSHTTDSFKRRQVTRTHTTDSFLRRAVAVLHTTDSNKRRATTKTHTTSANKRLATLKSHATDSNKKKSGLLVVHTTDSLLRKANVVTHTISSLIRKAFSPSHSTSANKKRAYSVSHSTDSNKKKSGNILVHTTNALKRTITVLSHTTDALKRSTRTLVHTTDSLLRRAITKTHTTSSNKRKATTAQHTTNANKRKSYTVSHSTDANKRKTGIVRTHTTSALLRREITLSHSTDANKKASTTVSHSTDSFARSGFMSNHNTDTNKRKATLKTHTTNANKKRANNLLTHTTSSVLRSARIVVHSTSSNKRKATSVFHTTNSVLRKAFSVVHSTDSFKYKAYTVSHTTGAETRTATMVVHYTNANKRLGTLRTHTTSSSLRESFTRSHTTDALLRVGELLVHTTDSFLRIRLTKTHTTDTLKRSARSVSHTTDVLIFSTEGKYHTTDTSLYTGDGTKQVLIDGVWHYAAVYILDNGEWVKATVYYLDVDNNWTESRR